MTNYGERVKELMFDKKVSPKKLSADLGVSLSTVYRWRKGETELLLHNLIALADYFRCSLDFILCRTEFSADFAPKKCPPFSQNLRKVMKERGLTTYKLRKSTRYDSVYFQKWDKGASPLASTLIELADLLDCSVDYLAGRE